MKRELTEKQQKFLDVLFDEAKGNFSTAARMAGYAEGSSTTHIVNSLKDEIAQLTRDYLANGGVKAAVRLMSILDDPTQLGAKEVIAASKDLLDRAGFKPSDKVEVKADSPLFILPEKKSNE